ncbi:MAG: TIGR03086 family protein [Candidatus Aeolococcus gillhamiae]|uniref:TIGR03086 family protein n=1 Tax=Candidatus Aeolococcus gillhamiae TaxID=3127015 RepID=A0A2W5YZE9_9BACT|nr:MAG: TIGR03086 family protein [Candidatus Dormibacter sp. RRmetagenome_bin12]
MKERDVFILAEQALADVIDQIRPEQWDQRKPEWFHSGGQGDASLREIVNYHAYDSAWVPDVLAGRTAAEVGDAYEHLKTDADVDYRRYSDAAVTAAQGLNDSGRIVHLSYGDFAAGEYFRHTTSFRGFRAFDIARWIGVSTELPPNLVQGMWDELSPDMEAWRAIGVYRAAVAVPDDAPLQDRLIGLSGRDPS